MLTLEVYKRYRKMCVLCGRRLKKGDINRFPLCRHSSHSYCLSRKRVLATDQGHRTLDCPDCGLPVCRLPQRKILRKVLLRIGRRHWLAEYRRQTAFRRHHRTIRLKSMKNDWSSIHVVDGLGSF